MAEDQPEQAAKRWVGYVCPACRMIFRMEAGHGGRRAQCPGCRALVVLGGKGKHGEAADSGGTRVASTKGSAPRWDELPAIAGPVPADNADPGEDPADTDPAGRQRVRKRKGVREEPAWERRKGKPWRPSKVVPVVVILVLAGLGAGVAFWARSAVGWRGDSGTVLRGRVVGGLEEEPGGGGGGGGSDSNPEASIRDLQDPVRRFLNAGTLDELLETVRDRERLEPAIRRFYADGYQPTPFRAVGNDGLLQTLGKLLSVTVELADFSRRPVAVERTASGYLVDWESWVGYSDLPWAEFMRLRPTEPMTFRVKSRKLDYYNFAFSDDQQWQSYRLESPDGQHTLYGYVPRDSTLAQHLHPLDPESLQGPFTVELAYPADATRPDQVLVHRVIASGWVLAGGEGSE